MESALVLDAPTGRRLLIVRMGTPPSCRGHRQAGNCQVGRAAWRLRTLTIRLVFAL